MPRRLIEIDGVQWSVTLSGRHTQYNKDEFTVLFRRVGGEPQRDLAGPLGREDHQCVLGLRTVEKLVDRRVGDALGVGDGCGHRR